MTASSPSIDWSGRYLEAGDLSIHYVRAGKGAPVVFLHGWPEFKRTWKHTLPVLAEHYDCIAPDLRGFGRSVDRRPRTATGTPPTLLVDDLLRLADALRLERIAIVSHDVGAFVAQGFAIAHPDRTAALFFGNCPYPGIGKRWGEFKHFPETWYQQFHQKPFAAALVGSSREACRIYFSNMIRHWCHQKAAFDDHLEEWVDNFMLPGNLQGGFDWYVGVSQFRRRMMEGAALPVPKITAPTYFYWGEHDPVVRFDFADKLDEYFTDYTLEKAEGAGHFCHFERPEAWNARLAAFLERVVK
jgi:pimeloyl-ACP methyl ester carboxylesterase